MADDIFIFAVGAESMEFRVHLSVFDGISQPLSYMMNNGKMEESLQKRAVLSDVESNTFSLLLRYAYITKLCPHHSLMAESAQNTALTVTSTKKATRFRCHWCEELAEIHVKHFPFCDNSCKNNYHEDDEAGYEAFCIVEKCVLDWTKDRSGRIFGEDHNNPYVWRKYPKTHLKAPKASEQGIGACTHSSTERSLETVDTTRESSLGATTVMQHAKLYALANRYIVKDLMQLCLQSLKAKLRSFEVNGTSVNELVDLVEYTFEHTMASCSDRATQVDELRELVLAYIVDGANELMLYEKFLDYLGRGGDHTVEFLRKAYSKGTK